MQPPKTTQMRLRNNASDGVASNKIIEVIPQSNM